MSEATKQEQQEPSMEEILASIRRIISDDGAEQQGQSSSGDAAKAQSPDTEASEMAEGSVSETMTADSPDETATSSATLDIEMNAAPEESAGSGDTTDTASEGGGAIDLRADDDTAAAAADQDTVASDEEPLELTQAIQIDGTVIDLAAARASAAAAETEAEVESRAPEEATAEVQAEPEPLDESEQVEGEPLDTKPLEAAQTAEPDPEPMAEEEAAEMPQAEADPSEEIPDAAEQEMSESPKIDTAEHERLMSEATEAATLAALSSVARSPEAEEAAPLTGGERTLEQVVRDAISEHLKVWLDTNLPDLVERVVREEVRRLARRAEDS